MTQVQSYNLRGTLNKEGIKCKRTVKLPIASLPTRIVRLEFRQEAKILWNYTLIEVGNLALEYTMQQQK